MPCSAVSILSRGRVSGSATPGACLVGIIQVHLVGDAGRLQPLFLDETRERLIGRRHFNIRASVIRDPYSTAKDLRRSDPISPQERLLSWEPDLQIQSAHVHVVVCREGRACGLLTHLSQVLDDRAECLSPSRLGSS